MAYRAASLRSLRGGEVGCHDTSFQPRIDKFKPKQFTASRLPVTFRKVAGFVHHDLIA
jgi:hypothetical protein